MTNPLQKKPPVEHVRHCPACGSENLEKTDKAINCRSCGFTLFFNPCIGTAGFIENDKGEILLIERGKDPAKGKLAPPGGFADLWESAEEALTREVQEETGLLVVDWHYLANAVNAYTYKEVTYPVLDLFFSARLKSDQPLQLCSNETTGARWIAKSEIDPDSLAFPSMQQAFRLLTSRD